WSRSSAEEQRSRRSPTIAFAHRKRRAPPSRRRGASPAARNSMNARGSGVVSRERRVFDKVRGRISKARGRKIQIIRKEIQSQGKQNPSFFLPRIGTIQGLAGESAL